MCASDPFLKLNLYRHALVTQRRPGDSVERRNFLRHLVEQTLDGGISVFAGDIVHQFMQKLPFRTSLATRRNSLHEFLHTTLAIHETAPLLSMSTAWQ